MHTVIQLTDTHLFADKNAVIVSTNPWQTLSRIVDHIGEHEQADLIVATGDLVHDETPAGYGRLLDALTQLETPVLYLPGNHDSLDAMRGVFADGACRDVTNIVLDGWRCIGLNTQEAGKVYGCLSDKILSLLRQELLNGERSNTVLFMHHPPVLTQTPWLDEINLRNREALLNEIELHPNIKAVFFGHIHHEIATQINNTGFYGTPSTCFQFKPLSQTTEYDTDEAPGYRKIQLHDDGSVHTSVVRVQ